MVRIALALILLAAWIPARASSCFEISVCSAYTTLPLIFRGEVLEVTPQPPRPPEPPPRDAEIPGLPAGFIISGGFPTETLDTVRFRVDEIFKGQPAQEITLAAHSGVFKAETEYLVYAVPNEKTGDMVVQSCARNHALSRQSMEPRPAAAANDKYYAIWHGPGDSDLQSLRAYTSGHTAGSATVSGHLFLDGSPLANAAVSITLGGPVTRTVQAQAGQRELFFLFKEVPPGTYTASARAPDGAAVSLTRNPTLSASNEPSLTLAADACREQNWFLRLDSHIRGRVTDTSGAPVAGTDVGVIVRGTREIDLARGRFAPLLRVKTDADGRYDFAGLNPGDYSVVLHQDTPKLNDPYPPVFYPAQAFPSDAAILHLAASKTLADIDLVRPAPLQHVTIRVLVTRRNGTPIERALILVADPASSLSLAATARTDSSGHADIPLFAGREYSIIASTPEPPAINSNGLPPQEEPVCAGPFAFRASESPEVTLTPDKSWNACRTAGPAKLP